MIHISLKLVRLLFISILIWGLYGCGEDDSIVPGIKPPGIYGKVINSNNVPVSGAAIHLIFSPENFQGNFLWNPSPASPGKTVHSALLQDDLKQNFPNPFDAFTSIPFQLQERSRVELTVYNDQGNKIITLLNREMSPGVHEVKWNGRNRNRKRVTNGLYRYQLITNMLNEEKEICMNTAPDELRQLNVMPLIQTNGDGEFYLAYKDIPFNRSVFVTDLQGFLVKEALLSKIAMVAVTANSGSDIINIRNDTTDIQELTFQVKP